MTTTSSEDEKEAEHSRLTVMEQVEDIRPVEEESVKTLEAEIVDEPESQSGEDSGQHWMSEDDKICNQDKNTHENHETTTKLFAPVLGENGRVPSREEFSEGGSVRGKETEEEAPGYEVSSNLSHSTFQAPGRHNQDDKRNMEEQKERNHTKSDEWDSKGMRKAQLKDIQIGLILQIIIVVITVLCTLGFVYSTNWPDMTKEKSDIETQWAQWDKLKILDGVLHMQCFEVEDDEEIQSVITAPRKMTVIRNQHDILLAGHLGSEKTTGQIKHSYHWPKMDEDRYDTCAAGKTSTAPLGNCGTGEPWKPVSRDNCGPFPVTEKNNRIILVVTDIFTRWAEAIPVPKIEAEMVAQFARKFGFPLEIKSGQRSNFESQLSAESYELLAVYKTHMTRPRSVGNATCGSFNRTLGNTLAECCQKNQEIRDQYFPRVTVTYQASEHGRISVSPNRMMFGKEVFLPMSSTTAQPKDDQSPTAEQHITDLQEKIQENYTFVKEHPKKTTTYQKRHTKHITFRLGQAVWLYNPVRKKRNWTGPFLVTRRGDDVPYKVKKKANEEAKPYHMDRLPAYLEQTPQNGF